MTLINNWKNKAIVLITFATSLALPSTAIATEYTFHIQATLVSEVVVDQPISAGTRYSGSSGYDEGLDPPKVPAQPSGFLACYFDRPEWDSPYGDRYSGDFREFTDFAFESKAWRFDIETDFDNAELLLTFNYWPPLDSSIALILCDLDDDTDYDLHDNPEVLIQNIGSNRHFLLKVGGDSPTVESIHWSFIKQVY
jgi:hypothetical protein